MDKFEMKVTEIVEHEDGSATVRFDIPGDGINALLQYALLDIITKAAQKTIAEQNPK